MSTIETIPRNEPASLSSARRSRTDYVRRLLVAAVSSIGWIDRALERRESRLALLEMTDEQLKDIGVSRADAHREGWRPFWD